MRSRRLQLSLLLPGEALMATVDRPATGAITFTVYGEPVPKGSKSAFAIRKGGVLTGKVAMVEGNKKRQSEWKARVHTAAQLAAGNGAQLFDGPVHLAVHFWLTKPVSAPKRRRTWPIRKPDIDKLLRGLLDPLTGVLLADDARIVSLQATKDYVADGGRPGADVVLWLLPEETT